MGGNYARRYRQAVTIGEATQLYSLNYIAGSGPQHHVVERTCPSNNSTIELPIDKLISAAYVDVETVPGFESVWSTRRSFFQFEVSLTDSSTTANMVIATAAQQDNEQSGAGGRRHASWRRPNRKVWDKAT